jgi:hypothetical protein
VHHVQGFAALMLRCSCAALSSCSGDNLCSCWYTASLQLIGSLPACFVTCRELAKACSSCCAAVLAAISPPLCVYCINYCLMCLIRLLVVMHQLGICLVTHTGSHQKSHFDLSCVLRPVFARVRLLGSVDKQHLEQGLPCRH